MDGARWRTCKQLHGREGSGGSGNQDDQLAARRHEGLCTSLSFLNRANIPGRIQKKLWLFGGGSERILRLVTYAFRRLDGWFGTRLCIYGWACYFGSGICVDGGTWTNACVRCGAGHPSGKLREMGLVKGLVFQCPQCGAKNYFTPGEKYQFLK